MNVIANFQSKINHSWSIYNWAYSIIENISSLLLNPYTNNALFNAFFELKIYFYLIFLSLNLCFREVWSERKTPLPMNTSCLTRPWTSYELDYIIFCFWLRKPYHSIQVVQILSLSKTVRFGTDCHKKESCNKVDNIWTKYNFSKALLSVLRPNASVVSKEQGLGFTVGLLLQNMMQMHRIYIGIMRIH